MTHSTRSTRSGQQNFPLGERSDGRWQKRVRGELHYFYGTADEALAEWLRVKEDLLAGRKPRPKPDTSAVTLRFVCNAFLTEKEAERDAGQLSPITWLDYRHICRRMIAGIGGGRVAADLGPDDFRALRASLAKTCGLNTIFATIVKVRAGESRRPGANWPRVLQFAA